MEINPAYNIAPLVVATIQHAARQAHAGNAQAKQWILDEGALWMDALGVYLPPEQLEAWVSRGCPLPKAMQAGPENKKPHRKPQDERYAKI
jgi:hypothetical protein